MTETWLEFRRWGFRRVGRGWGGDERAEGSGGRSRWKRGGEGDDEKEMM